MSCKEFKRLLGKIQFPTTAKLKDVIKYKVKWLLKTLWFCINRPFDILMGCV